MLSTLNKISHTHTTCEDNFFVNETEDGITGGVFDGCSTGTNSHWAAQTFAYLFGKYRNPTSNLVICRVTTLLSGIMNTLGLTNMHVLATCLLFEYNKKTLRFRIRVFGDGYYYLNSREYEIEQENRPDYLGYHLDDEIDLNKYLDRYPTEEYENVTQFCITTDGIQALQISQFKEQKHDAKSLLLHPPDSTSYLNRMWNILKKEGWYLNDDLTIISYVQN